MFYILFKKLVRHDTILQMVFRLSKYSALITLTTNACKRLQARHLFTFSKVSASSTVNAEEVKKFDSTSDEWWNTKKYDLLHLYNTVRVPLIRDGILAVSKSSKSASKPLDGYSILDVGCGGGILSEPLARLGAKVTGLDPGEHNVQAATEHASKDPEIKDNVFYICDTVENLAKSDKKFDAVVASEVIEHVNDVPTFVQSCVELAKPSGSLFFTTINQTYASYLVSILFAEYILDLIPKGTHDWNKFVKPTELIELLESQNCRIVSNEGVLYNPVLKKFYWCKNTDVIYTLHAVKL